jgi:D-alanine-D-alanine ligase
VKIGLLHTTDAAGPPEDPVLGQLEEALHAHGDETFRAVVGDDIDPLIAQLRREAPDLLFNMAVAFAGKSALESNVAGLLNLLGLRYTGSSPSGLMVAGDKALTKKILSFHQIKTPQFATVYRGALDSVGNLEFPVIVKPPQEDASLGISSSSVVREIKDLLTRMDELQTEYQQPVLVEEFVDGREFYVGVLGNASAVALPVIELDFSKFPADKPKIASYAAKWGDDGAGSGDEYAGTESIFPTGMDPALVEPMEKEAVEALDALRQRDYARIDLRVTPSGEIFVIEVNPNCYLERSGEFARAAEKGGFPYPALVERIVDLATARYSR